MNFRFGERYERQRIQGINRKPACFSGRRNGVEPHKKRHAGRSLSGKMDFGA